MTNHLGNVLATISDKKQLAVITTCLAMGIDGVCLVNGPSVVQDYFGADVVTATDYYPFGMAMPDRKYSDGDSYRYGFNGKENDKDISEGGQDYGMRIYDGRLGRFLSVDPITDKYPELTPYQFASNNPVSLIDIDGLEGSKPQTATVPLPVLNNPAVQEVLEKLLEGFRRLFRPTPTPGRPIFVPIPLPIPVILPDPANPGNKPSKLPDPSKPPLGTIPFGDPRSVSKDKPSSGPKTKPGPLPNPDKPGDDYGNKPKVFYVTYTKSKLNSDGTISTYSGRSSGFYLGPEPTSEDKQIAVDRRENSHKILNAEGYSPAILDQSSTNRASIRGREQQLIDYYGGAQSEGGYSRNKIRGIGRDNPFRPLYDAAATTEFGKLSNNNPVDKKNN